MPVLKKPAAMEHTGGEPEGQQPKEGSGGGAKKAMTDEELKDSLVVYCHLIMLRLKHNNGDHSDMVIAIIISTTTTS